MGKIFRLYNLNQRLLLPPNMRQWLPEGHLGLFRLDVVNDLHPSEIVEAAEAGDERGQPPYHPAMMVVVGCRQRGRSGTAMPPSWIAGTRATRTGARGTS
jgi:hypothetical protein